MTLTDVIYGKKKGVQTPVVTDAQFISSTNVGGALGMQVGWHGFRFSRDYQYALLTTSSGGRPQYWLKINELSDPSTWALHTPAFYNADWRGAHINNAGTKIYGGVNTLQQVGVSPAYGNSSSLQHNSGGYGSSDFIGGIQLNPDETKLFVCGSGAQSVFSEFNLSSAGNVAGRTLVQTKSLLPTVHSERGFTFYNEGMGILSSVNGGSVMRRTVSQAYTLNDLSEAEIVTGASGGMAVEINEIERLLFTIDGSNTVNVYSY